MDSFNRRLRAFSIDLSFALVIVVPLLGITKIDASIRGWIAIAVYYGVLVLPYLFGNSQTFGKRIQRMKVVYNTKELVPDYFETPNRFILVLRAIFIATASLFTVFFYVMIAAIISNGREDGRTIHDFIFKTRVVPITKYVDDPKEIRGKGQVISKKGYGPFDD